MRAWTDGLYDLLRDGDVLDAAAMITHEVPLEQAPEYYKLFRDRNPVSAKSFSDPDREPHGDLCPWAGREGGIRESHARQVQDHSANTIAI